MDEKKDLQDNKLMALLAYLWILFLVPLLTKKDSPYVMFHVKQGLVLFIAWLVVGIIWIIPIIGWLVGAVGYIALIVLNLIGIFNVLGGKKEPLPLIGKYAEQFNL